MALRYIDGFDNHADGAAISVMPTKGGMRRAATLPDYGNNPPAKFNGASDPGSDGRGGCFTAKSVDDSGGLSWGSHSGLIYDLTPYNTASNQVLFVVGFSVYLPSLPASAMPLGCFTSANNTDGNGHSTASWSLAVDTDGTLLIQAFDLQTKKTSIKLTPGVRHYIELETYSTSVSQATMYIQVDGTYSDYFPRTQNNNYVLDTFILGFGYNGIGTIKDSYNVSFDDMYLLDNQGETPNSTFLGNCRVDTIFGNGINQLNDFSAVGGSSGDPSILGKGSDDASSYYATPNDGSEASAEFNLGSHLPSAVTTVYGIAFTNLAASNFGASIRPLFIDTTVTQRPGGSFVPMAIDFRYYCACLGTQPRNGNPWDPSSFNGNQAFGFDCNPQG